jgi:cell division protein FtsB
MPGPSATDNLVRNRRLKSAMILTLALVFFLWALAPLGARLKQQGEIDALRAEKARVEAENTALRKDIRRLREDPSRIESLARKNLGLIKEGEEAYKVIEPPAPAVKKKPPPPPPGPWERFKKRLGL